MKYQCEGCYNIIEDTNIIILREEGYSDILNVPYCKDCYNEKINKEKNEEIKNKKNFIKRLFG